jgi:hypothetical protein
LTLTQTNITNTSSTSASTNTSSTSALTEWYSYSSYLYTIIAWLYAALHAMYCLACFDIGKKITQIYSLLLNRLPSASFPFVQLLALLLLSVFLLMCSILIWLGMFFSPC